MSFTCVRGARYCRRPHRIFWVKGRFEMVECRSTRQTRPGEARPRRRGETPHRRSINNPLVGWAWLARMVSRCKQYVVNRHIDGDGLQADVVL